MPKAPARYAHILVTHLYEAEDVLRLLNGGKAFADLAEQFSKCPSAQQGGDLGPINLSRTHEDFADAAESLKPGEHSKKPVRTPSGYHIIWRLPEEPSTR